MRHFFTAIFLLGLSVALLSVFILMGIKGSYVAIESIGAVYYAELALFAFFVGWSIYRLIWRD